VSKKTLTPHIGSRPNVGPTQLPILWGPGLSPGVKRPERKVDRSPIANSEGQEGAEVYLHSPIRLYCVVLYEI
jgi:hypothetical protein